MKEIFNKTLKSKLLLVVIGITALALLLINILPLIFQESYAATSFTANYNSSLDATYSAGDGTAYSDGTPAELVSPGYGGSGSALNISGDQTLRYPTENNLNTSKGEIEMKFQLPEDMIGDMTKDSFYSLRGTYYDTVSEYVYVADSYNHRIVKTKIDGTGWTTYGTYGAGAGQFNSPTGIFYDAASEYIYITDSSNHRIVKTKIDGTGWTTYGTYGAGAGQFNNPTGIFYDAASEYIYIAAKYNRRIVKTKIDGTGWTTYGTYGTGVGQFTHPDGIYYDSASDYIYVSDSYNHRIVKTKIDGTGWATYGSSGTGVGQFKYPYSISFDPTSEYIYVADSSNKRIVKTKMDSSVWENFGAAVSCTGGLCAPGSMNQPRGFWHDPASGYFYIAQYGNYHITRSKWDSEDWRMFTTPPMQTILRTNSASANIWLAASPAEGKIYFYPSRGAKPYVIQTDTLDLDSSSWHSLKINWTQSTGEVNLYIDDVLEGSQTFGEFVSSGDYFYVASDPFEPLATFGGYVDNLSINKLSNDAADPTNPTAFGGWDSSEKNSDVVSDSWHNHENPYFEFSGADDDSSGVRGYFVYFGTDDTADPFTAGVYQSHTGEAGATQNYTSSVDLATGETYYLLIKTQDNDLNISDAISAGFNYKYDATNPDPPTFVNVSPVGCSVQTEFDFSWDVGSDLHSGVSGYQYKVGTAGTVTDIAEREISASAYQEGDNGFYARSRDNAGNTSSWQTAIFCSVGATYIIDGPEVTTGPSSINVTWISSKSTTGYVKVYEGNSYISEQGHTSFGISHDVQVVGLEPAKSYRYKLVWSDESSNLGESAWYETSTETPPAFTNVTIETLSPTEMLVNWETSEDCETVLYYGPETASNALNVSGSGKTFNRKISGLEAGYAYSVRIKATTTDDYIFYSDSYSFQTPPLPKISSLRFETIDNQSANGLKVNWETNVSATSTIYYKTQGEGSYQQESIAEKAIEHEMLINNLLDSSTYQIYVSGIDDFGNIATSDVNTFTTPLDSRPPTISEITIETSNVGLGNQDEAQIVVSWKTDEPATSFVEYGEGISGTEYNFKTNIDPTLTTSHLVIISGLKESTPYHLHVASSDKGDNTSYSIDNTVIPGEVKKSTLSLILKALSNAFGWLGTWF